MCISVVIGISPRNLDSSLCFFQPSVSHDVLCIWVKYAGWQYTVLTYSFPNLEPGCFSMSDSICFFLVRWSSIPISWRISHSLLWSKQSNLLSHVQLFVTPLATQIMELSRPEYWSILPFCSRGNLPNTGIKPRSPTLQEDSLRAQPPGKPIVGWVTHVDKRLLLECCAVLCLVAHPVNCLWPHILSTAAPS